MAWIFGIVILILLIVSAGFRKFAGVLLLICIAGGFLYWQYQEHEERESKARISSSELRFENVLLQSSYGTSYDFVGRITNMSSKYTLRGFQVKFTFSDCDISTANSCVIVAQDEKYVYLNVPPGQARDFKEGVYLNSNLKYRGKMSWNYSIVYTSAE